MKKVYEVCNAVGNEVGKFSLSLSKRNGFQYEHIYGKAPTWGYIAIIAAIDMFERMHISSAESMKENSEYSLVRDNNVDIRFVPILVVRSTGKTYKLPMTVDENEILEHSFSMTFHMAVKVMLALTMSYGKDGLSFDEKKINKVVG